jgi:hypothetical protein
VAAAEQAKAAAKAEAEAEAVHLQANQRKEGNNLG